MLKFKAFQFTEHPVVDFAQTEPSMFDITTVGLNYPSSFVIGKKFSFEAYCHAFLLKVGAMDKLLVPDFLEYQCNLLKNPVEWLNQVEILFESNIDFFEDEKTKRHIQKLYVNLQICRENHKRNFNPIKKELVNLSKSIASDEEVMYDFRIVKLDLHDLKTNIDKKAYLMRRRADFLQSDFKTPAFYKRPFDELINIELGLIDDIEKLETEMQLSSQRIAQINLPSSKIRLTGNTNLLGDFLYQMLYEFKPEGKVYFDCPPTTVANLVSNNFLNKKGENISVNSIMTTLSPGKVEKRPSCDKRFCLRNLNNNKSDN